MAPDRIVSLAPSATATLTALGAADRLVGVTSHSALDRPSVGGWLTPDFDRLADLDPDFVCTSDALQREIRDDLRDRGYDVFHHEPERLGDVLAGFEPLAVAAGCPAVGVDLRSEAEARLQAINDRVDRALAAGHERPVVYCEEWSDPPMAAGNWVPDAVEAAGGRYPFVDPGERSRDVSHETVAAADPDHAILHICGTGEGVSPDRLRERGWELDAAVHVVDDSLLNQPSPRLIDGIERLAEWLVPTSDEIVSDLRSG